MVRSTFKFIFLKYHSSPEAQRFVTIIVGKAPAQQEFRIHKTVTDYYSPDFFGRAFNSAMIEGQTRSMILEDVDPFLFGLIYNWLYTQKLVDEHGEKLKLIEYTKIWSLARRFLLTELEGDALECIELVDSHVDIEGHPKSGSTMADFLRYAYEDAPEEQRSELQSIAIQKTVKLTGPGDVDALMEFMPQDMILHFIMALVRRHLDDWVGHANAKR
jgi:hypothetical protein